MLNASCVVKIVQMRGGERGGGEREERRGGRMENNVNMREGTDEDRHITGNHALCFLKLLYRIHFETSSRS